MKICLMTNTYLPHVGGVARSVSTFAHEYRRLGHDVLVVAPDLPGRVPARAEALVERVAAIQNFNGSDFAVRLPLAATLSRRLDAFEADIIHAHHPFLLGDTALRVAVARSVPIIFTHHTRYEDYVHYVPFSSPALRRAAIQLSTAYANLCDAVFAPSESIASLIRRRGVIVPIRVVPTGIDVAAFAAGDGTRFRAAHGLPARAFVVGHVGRLAPEKNLGWLADAIGAFLRRRRDAWALIVGTGPAEAQLRGTFDRLGVAGRVVLAGAHLGRSLADAYRAMDVFAFSSRSETQGLVVTEAMAAGLPVVALRAPGVRDVVEHGGTGYLLADGARPAGFAARLERLRLHPGLRRAFGRAARAAAAEFSRERCARRALGFYEEIRLSTRRERLLVSQNPWRTLQERLGVEWELLSRNARALTTVVAS
ncbi:MAG TPA: glycosyltransferase [Lacunisphaera sp.]|jgi:glycosyltransferase involved in cell wall biosynthesis|nr:glycosyltransferase [Lacunisphaera sp.]